MCAASVDAEVHVFICLPLEQTARACAGAQSFVLFDLASVYPSTLHPGPAQRRAPPHGSSCSFDAPHCESASERETRAEDVPVTCRSYRSRLRAVDVCEVRGHRALFRFGVRRQRGEDVGVGSVLELCVDQSSRSRLWLNAGNGSKRSGTRCSLGTTQDIADDSPLGFEISLRVVGDCIETTE